MHQTIVLKEVKPGRGILHHMEKRVNIREMGRKEQNGKIRRFNEAGSRLWVGGAKMRVGRGSIWVGSWAWAVTLKSQCFGQFRIIQLFA